MLGLLDLLLVFSYGLGKSVNVTINRYVWCMQYVSFHFYGQVYSIETHETGEYSFTIILEY